ncbi:hypothetical protein BDR22DRAFT_862258 [Usnea florida]
MADSEIYTRAYSKSSAGQLFSAKGPNGDPLSYTALLEEFRNHAKIENREPTALVSASDRIVDTLKRAFNKHYEHGESSVEIWIAFIEVPPTMNETVTRIHSAKELAEKCEHPEPNFFSHEVVFEWAIPERYVLHKVSLQTLMERELLQTLVKRELPEHWFLQPTTAEVRCYIARLLQRDDPWDIGVTLGSFARKFGARAPLNWISHQLFYDCVWAKIVDDDVVRLKYAHGHTGVVDFPFFCELDDGIDTTLYDWWLSDVDFFQSYEEFERSREVMEDSITWDLIDFWEAWHDVDNDGTINELSAKGKLSYDEEKNNLLVRHEEKRAFIEAKAVEIGL